MKALFIGIGVLIVLVLGMLFVVPSLVPSETYRATIQEQLTRQLGRTVTIDGDVSVSTFPVIKAKADRAAIANPPGFSRDNLASLQRLDARIKLWPLLRKRVEISRFILVEPDILLERLPDGQVNWELGKPAADMDAPKDPAKPFARDGRYADIDPSLAAFEIEGGRLLYIDQVSDTRRDLTDMNIFLSLPDMTQALDLRGEFLLDGNAVELDVMMDSPRAFLDGKETRLTGTFDTQGASLSLDGTLPPGTAITFDGALEGALTDVALIRDFMTEPVDGLDLLQSAQVSADLSSEGTDGITKFSNLDLNAKGDAFNLTFTGSGQYADDLSVTGRYDLTATNVAALARRFAPDLTRDADIAGNVKATGNLIMEGETIRVTNLVAETKSAVVSSRYEGAVSKIGDTLGADGTFSASIPSVAALNAATINVIPYSDAIGKLTATGRVTGQADNLRIDNLAAELSDGQINGTYTGRAALAEETSLAGELSVSGPSLRALAAKSGTTLPPSTDAGPVFEAFALSGAVSGPVDTLSLSNAALSLDNLSAAGQFALTMTGETPLLTGNLDLPGLDLRPYMAAYSAQRPEGAIQPWSQTSIPTEGLRAIDADLSLTTPNIKMTRLTLGKTQARAVLSDGVLTTTIPEFGLYGGSGRATFVMDGRGAQPKIDLTAGLNNLKAQNFLGAVAGFTKANGTAATDISLSGSGASQAAIMKSLTGGGNFTVADGAISGIDAGEFLTGLQSALSSRSLPNGLGADKMTQFKNLIGKFSMTDGVAKIDDFALSAAQVKVEGSGQIDLGNQTMDVRLRPRTLGDNARGLAAFGIPLRFSGAFGAAKPSLDSEFLGEVIQARAAAEARNAISDRIGGEVVGGILGSIIGGNTPAEQPATETPAPETSETEPEADAEVEDEPAPEPNPEALLEDALKGLFGGKKEEKGKE